MATPIVVEERELSVTRNKGKEQIWLGASRLLKKALFSVGKTFRLIHCEDGSIVADLIDEHCKLKPMKGEVQSHEYTVTAKGKNPILDLKNLTDVIKGAQKVKVVYMQGRIIISVHDADSIVEERESDLVKTLDDGHKLKIGSIFSGTTMRNRLKRLGLNKLANDTTCKLIIETEPTMLEAAMFEQPEQWQQPSLAAVGAIESFDFSSCQLPKLNGLLIDASSFDIKTDKSKGRSRTLSADDDCDPTGMVFFNTFAVLKLTNPAFVEVEMSLAVPPGKNKADEADYLERKSTIMTIYLSVLEASGYTVTKKIDENAVTLTAISKNLSLDDLARSTVVSSDDTDATPIVPEFLQPSSIEERIKTRNERVKRDLLSGKPFKKGSIFSGGGVLDRGVHAGFTDMGVDSYCKFGMEWKPETAINNIHNNDAIYRSDSCFRIGDVRNVNVYFRKTPLAHGVAAGVPCVGASIAGISKNKIKNAEEHKLAGSLFINTLEIFICSESVWLQIENVTNYQNTVGAEIIRSVLHYQGYDIFEDTFKGNDFGALENRDRFLMTCMSKGVAERNPLDYLQAVCEKQNTLNDIKEFKAPDDTAWKWLDYLDAKQERDAAAGKGFANRQLLTGEETKNGTIGRDYQKARSTEPFFIFEEGARFAEIHQAYATGECSAADLIDEVITRPAYIGMYANFAKNAVDKYNRRQRKLYKDEKLGEWTNITSQLHNLASKILNSSYDCTSHPISKFKQILADAYEIRNAQAKDYECLWSEFVDQTLAISKATRLFSVTEHCAVKRVPDDIVEGYSATDAHAVLGNGVIFTLFQSLGRQIACDIMNYVFNGVVHLIPLSKAQNFNIPAVQGEVSSHTAVLSDNQAHDFVTVGNVDTFYYIHKTKIEYFVSRFNSGEIAIAA